MKQVLFYDSAQAICSSVFIFLTTSNVPTKLRQAGGRERSAGLINGAIRLNERGTQPQPRTSQPAPAPVASPGQYVQFTTREQAEENHHSSLNTIAIWHKETICRNNIHGWFCYRFTITPPLPAGVNTPDLENTSPACICYLITMIFRNLLCGAQSRVINLQ